MFCYCNIWNNASSGVNGDIASMTLQNNWGIITQKAKLNYKNYCYEHSMSKEFIIKERKESIQFQ